jgi:lipopolysaccharide transport system permease protein
MLQNQDVLIRPSSGIQLRLRELWVYRELLFFLTWRDLKVRYKQTIIGLAWAVIQPVLTMVVFTLFFHELAQIPSVGNIPYTVFSLAALVPWTFFSSGLTKSTNSLVTSANLLKKVYFPRLIIPLSALFSSSVDFVIALAVLLIMVPFSNIGFTVNVFWLLPFFLLAFITSLGVGLWFSTMNVQFRDIGYVIPFIIQLWMFATPVVYSSDKFNNMSAQPTLQFVAHIAYVLNPMASVIDGFRWALFGTPLDPSTLLISVIIALLIFISGLYYFSRFERTFADVV